MGSAVFKPIKKEDSREIHYGQRREELSSGSQGEASASKEPEECTRPKCAGWTYDHNIRVRIKLIEDKRLDRDHIGKIFDAVGKVTKVESGPGQNEVFITFESTKAITKLKSKKRELERQFALRINIEEENSIYDGERKMSDEGKSFSECEDEDEESDTETTCWKACIEFSNVSRDIGRADFMKFIKPKVSGKIHVESRNPRIGYVVLFQTEKDAQKLYTDQIKTPLLRSGLTLSLRIIDDEILEKMPFGHTTKGIKITECARHVTEDYIRRAFRGDVIETVYLQPDLERCIVTYRTHENTEDILHRKVQLEKKHSVKIDMLRNQYRPNKLFGNHIKDKVFIKGLPPYATRHTIEDYITHGTGVVVRQIMFGKTLMNAMVQFHGKDEDNAYEKLYMLSRMKPLNEHMITVHRVPQPKSLQIALAKQGQLDTIEITRYFDYSAAPASNVTEEEDGFIADFPCPTDVEQHMKDGPHVINGNEVAVQPLYDCLGYIPPDHDMAKPNIHKHADIPAMIDSLLKLRFIKQFPEHEKSVEQAMEKVATFVKWPQEATSTNVMLECVLTGKERDFEKKLQSWEDTAQKNFEFAVSKFCEERLVLDPKVRRQFTSCWQFQNSKAGPDWIWEIRPDDGIIIIIGNQNPVKEQYAAAQKLHKSLVDAHGVKDKFMSIRHHIDHSLMRLKPFEVELQHQLSNNFQSIKWNILDCGLNLEGPEDDIEEFTVLVDSITMEYVTEIEPISIAKGRLLERRPVIEMLKKEFESINVSVGYHASGTKLQFHAVIGKDIFAAQRKIEQVIKEDQLAAEPDRAHILKTPKWDAFVLEMEHKYTNQFDIDLAIVSGDGVVITLAKLNVLKTNIFEDIQDFLNRNGIANTQVQLESGATFLLDQFHKTQLNTWRMRLVVEGSNEDGCIEMDPDLPGFILTGAQELIPNIVDELRQFAGKVVTESYQVTKPGMSKYFVQHWNDVTSFGFRKQVIVTLGKDHQKRNAPLRRYKKLESTKDKRHTMAIKCEGFDIKVMLADITEIRVDAIVNAANDELRHLGGLANAIVKAGGKEIQDECSKYIQIHGSLKPGETFVSKAGKLPCKYIIHTVGPKYIDGQHNEDQRLFAAVYNAIETACRKKCKSVCIPAISSGIYGYPHDECAEQIALAVVSFAEGAAPSKTTLEEIIFADVNHDFVEIITNKFLTMLPNTQTSEPLPGIYDTEDAENMFEEPQPLLRPKSSIGRPKTASGRPKTASKNRSLHNKGLEVQLHIGDIVNEQVDVIVNTTSKGLDLSKGAVSKHILQCAGNSIQTELHQFAPNGIQFGEVAQSGGGQLACREIYHTSLKEYNGGNRDSIEVFTRTVRTCLEKAQRSSYKSIVFPALGTGALGFPPGIVARLILETTEAFTKVYSQCSLKVVVVAVIAQDGNIIQAFKNEGIHPNAPAGKGLTTRFAAVVPAAKKGTWKTKEGVSITVESGDIATYTVDVIVNACGKGMDLNTGGLSSYILNKAGTGIQTECRANVPNGAKYGEIVKTSGGNLLCREIYHCACQNFCRTSKEPLKVLKQTLSRCLVEAHSSGYNSIAFPAVGAGGLGFKPQVCAQVMDDCIKNLSRMHPATLLSITIVLRECDTANIQAFMQYVDTSADSEPNGPSTPTELVSYGSPGSSVAAHSDLVPEPHISFVREITFAREAVKASAFGSLNVQVIVGEITDQKMVVVGFTLDGRTISIATENYIVVDLGDRSKIAISDALTSILQQGESQHISSLAVPVHLLETDKYNPSVVSAMIAERIYTFSEQTGFRYLKVLRFVVRNETSSSTYHKMLKDKSANITMYLHSMQKGNITQVTNWVYEACIENSTDEILTTMYQEEISNLTDEDVKAVKALEDRYPIQIEIKRKPPLLTVKGLQDDISKVKEKLQEFQRQWLTQARKNLDRHDEERQETVKQLDDTYALMVQWQYSDNNETWKPYTKRKNRLIEVAFAKKEHKIYIPVEQRKRFIDLTSLHEYDEKGTVYNVRRRDTDSEIPETWSGDFAHGKVILEEVGSTTGEYKEITDTFTNSITATGKSVTILKVIRIQNKFLWIRYANKRKNMVEMKPAQPVETHLWHGTTHDVLDFINSTGFDKSYFGKNGVVYGIGVYFACTAEYSHRYAKPNPHSQDERAMYYTKVLTGDFAQGSAEIKVPPVKSGTTTYDSVVDKMDPNLRKMYVIFHQDQSYPEYLIKYKEN